MPTPSKYNSIDHLRFVLIVLVLVVHIVHFGELNPAVKERISFFFMPAFLLLTGYLVNVHKSARAFGLYLVRIALPYAIMVLAYGALSLVLPVRDGLTDFAPATVARMLLVTSIGPYWFLHVMLVCGVLYYVAARLGRRWGGGAVLSLFGALLIVVAAWTPLLTERNALFYFLGAALRTGSPQFFSQHFRPTLWAVVPFGLIIGSPHYDAWGLLAVAALSVCFIAFVPALFNFSFWNKKLLHAAGYVGRNTFPIYLFHPIFTMAAKFMLPLFAFDPSGIVHTLTCIVLGVAGSLCIALLMDRTRLAWVFGKATLLR